MVVNVIKPHHHYSLGDHEVTKERGNYLIATGIAEEIGIYSEKELTQIKKEKVEFGPTKEKAETKAGAIPKKKRGRKTK